MKTKLLSWVLVLSLIGLCGFIDTSYADSKTLCVPDDFATIQEAINASIDGDTIVVFKGKYKGNINFKGKSITLTSTDPLNPDVVAKTIIEGTEDGSVITLDSNAVLKGFTITSKNLDCRGIYCSGASPTIENCTIIDNETTSYGGGIYATEDSSPQITNCIITGNKDSSTGESAQVYGGELIISYSWIGQDLVNTTEPTTTADEEPTEEPIIPTSETTPAVEPASTPTEEPTVSTTSITTAGEIHGEKWDDCNRNGVYDGRFFIVFVIDTSYSVTGELLQTEKEAFTALNQKLIDYGLGSGVGISIVEFNSFATQLDMDPTLDPILLGYLLSTKAGADLDTNSIPDVQDILRDDISSTLGSTYFKAALQKTIETIDQIGATYGETLVIFMSDGIENGLPFDDEIETLREMANYVRAFDVGSQPIEGDDMWKIDETAEMYTDPQTMWESLALDIGEEGEPPLAEVAIYLDSNNDGEWDDGEPLTTTDADGKYSFTDLSAGTYIVREVLQSGWLQTFPAEGFHEVILGTDDEKVYDINFGNYSGACNSIWYVDDSAPSPDGDGTTWTTAFKYLQDALNNTPIQAGKEIRVAEGTYKPDQDKDNPNGTDDRTATFQLKNGVAIKGGYAGIGEARDIETYETILSGDLIGNDGDPPDFAYYNDNSYHVVTRTSGGVYRTTILDGFIIEGGNSNNPVPAGEEGMWARSGGGMRNESSSPVVKNCTFRYNKAYIWGGAIANLSSSPRITNCTFIGNRVELGGGAIFGYESYLQVKNCTFIDNYSRCRGGAIKNESTQSTIINCMFSNNTGHYCGGAIDNGVGSSVIVTNCVFAGNTAGSGGGLSNRHSSVVITNCTFNKNRAKYAGGIFNQGDEEYSSATLRNCIIWDNNDEVKSAPFFTKSIIISHCDIKGWSDNGWAYMGREDPLYPGHNRDIDPLFVDPSNPVGHGLQLDVGSPCIDTAHLDYAPITDMLGQGRVDVPDMGYHNYVHLADMGAYEFIP